MSTIRFKLFLRAQFWYTEETSERVAAEVVEVAAGGSIACLACPSLFRKLRSSYPDAKTQLFEFDPRFEVLSAPKSLECQMIS